MSELCRRQIIRQQQIMKKSALTVLIALLLWGIERSGFFNGREKWAKGFENQRV